MGPLYQRKQPFMDDIPAFMIYWHFYIKEMSIFKKNFRFI